MIAIYELNDVRPLIDLYIKSYLRTCERYNVTFDAFGFDELGARYRQQRRDVIRHIILNDLHDAAMDKYIQDRAEMLVTQQQLGKWKKS